MIKMFGKYLGKKYRLISLLAVFGMVMEVVVENLVPLVMANLIDNGIQAQNINVVLRAGGLMVALALFGMVFGSIGGYTADLHAGACHVDFHACAHLQHQPEAFDDFAGRARLSSACTDPGHQICG